MPALHVDHREGPGTPLVLLHGFTQTGALWGPFGDAVGESRPLALVDLPGHGGSGGVAADLPATAALVADAVAGAAPYDLCGYSLGGRVALQLALDHPGAVRRLVLLSATPGIPDAGRRAERRARDEALADALVADGDVAAFVDRWLAGPLFARVPPDRTGRAGRAANTAAGLAESLRQAGTGTQVPLWDRLGGLECPVLCMAGATDDRFSAVARRMVQALPAATLALVPGAGHAVHLEQPALVAKLVVAWLDGLG